jgi:hypothetical protein
MRAVNKRRCANSNRSGPIFDAEHTFYFLSGTSSNPLSTRTCP